MFRVTRMPTAEVDRALLRGHDLEPASPALLTLDGLPAAKPPAGYAHDKTMSLMGAGEEDFSAACEALDRWMHFDLGWVRVANPQAPIAIGQIIAVEAHTLGLWSLNLSVITEVSRSERRFGFLYTTTRAHVEIGQERFVLEHGEDGSVSYTIEAVSRPRHLLARIAYPFARMMQHRFARDSHARMWRAVANSERGAAR